MDNYFILSSKVGDKWTKVTSNMTSVKLGTCIHIMGTYLFCSPFMGILTNRLTIILTITFTISFMMIPSITQLSSQWFHDHFHSRSQLSFRHSFHSIWVYFHNLFLLVYLVSLGARLKKRVVRLVGYWRGGLSSLWDIEEAGCQAREQFLSRWENCWELIS